jgi:hypothetical protein
MRERFKAIVRRRGLLRAMMVGAATAATNTVARPPTAAESRRCGDKRRVRYRAKSVEVQDFYRVNY